MTMIPVRSSNLTAAGYDPWRQRLDITFHRGRAYAYFRVPLSVFHSLLAAPSKGRYHARYIKWVYPYERIR